MAGGGKQQTTSTSSNAPWSSAQPALNTALADAQNLYKAGVGAQTYTGSTVIPWSSQTTQGMNAIQNNASQNLNGQGASGQYQSVINSGGYNAAQNDAMNNTRNLANSSYSVSPELQKVLDAQASKVSDQVNLNAAGAGRYGSGSNQTLLAKNIGDLTNSTIYNDYSNWLGRRDAANTNLFNMGQQGFNNVGAAYSGMKAPAQDLMNVGSMYEDLATRQKNDELRIFDGTQNAQWNNLSRLNAIASGAGQLGGTTTQSQPGQNPFLTAAGYGLSGLGLLGGL